MKKINQTREKTIRIALQLSEVLHKALHSEKSLKLKPLIIILHENIAVLNKWSDNDLITQAVFFLHLYRTYVW